MMRTACWLFALASGACGSATPQRAPVANVAPAARASVVLDGAQLADALVRLEPDEVIRLVDLGWFHKISAQELAWVAEPPEPAIADDERTLFLGVAYPADPPEKYPRVQVRQYSWAETLGSHAAKAVRDQGFVTISHVGRFEAGAGRIVFVIDDELKHRMEIPPRLAPL